MRVSYTALSLTLMVLIFSGTVSPVSVFVVATVMSSIRSSDQIRDIITRAYRDVLGRDLALVRQALASFTPGQEVNDWYARGGLATRALGRVILAAYYRDDRVLRALGHEARPPFPKGYVVEQGDWSLVDAVRSRAPFWRDDRKASR